MKSLLAAAALVTVAGVSQAWALPNPASVYCNSLGGHLESRNEPGGEVDDCHLPDGRVVEEWTLFRSANRAAPVGGGRNPASAYCASLDGRLEIRRERGGEAGYCHLPNQRVVEEWTLFRSAK